jgi:prokaryotic YEATS domain
MPHLLILVIAICSFFPHSVRSETVEGKVIAVSPKEVFVEVLDPGAVAVNDPVEIMWTAPDGETYSIRNGRVRSVDGNTVTVDLGPGSAEVQPEVMRASIETQGVDVKTGRDKGSNDKYTGEPEDKGQISSSKARKPGVIIPRNVATNVDEKLWDWSAYIESDAETLAAIECVEYTLHRSFQKPVQTVCDIGSPERAFATHASGWGTFTIKIRVLFRDGTVRHLSHQLEF